MRRMNNSRLVEKNVKDRERFDMRVDMHPYDMENEVGSGGDMNVDITF